jgi:hypothetical protein
MKRPSVEPPQETFLPTDSKKVLLPAKSFPWPASSQKIQLYQPQEIVQIVPKSLGLSRTERDKPLYVCGGTGTGKSKFLENLIRQDIRSCAFRLALPPPAVIPEISI